MKRSVLVLTVMVLGIALLLWAGWHNLRERRLRMQEAAENRVTLTPANPANPSNKGQEGGGAGEAPRLEGKLAPGFALVNLEGKRVSLADYKGRPVLVNFWATWCAPCKLEMPWFEDFRKQYASQGFEILGIAEDDAGKDAIEKTVRKTGVTYPILLTDGKVASLYGGVDYLPMSFYVDRTGKVVEETAGLNSKDEVEANIRKIVGPGSGAVASAGTTAGGGQ